MNPIVGSTRWADRRELSPEAHATAQCPNREWRKQSDLQGNAIEPRPLSEIQERKTGAYKGR